MRSGAFVISFDFEMAWGMRRSSRRDDRAKRLGEVREVVDGLLEIFAKHAIPATWATVGHLMLREEDCPNGRYEYDLPAPEHEWFDGDWYDGIPAFGELGAEVYYAPDLIEKILACDPPQEIASHTFSHVVVGERGCSKDVAQAEFAKCQEIAANWGQQLTSVVFPRNVAGHLDALRDNGYRCFRGPKSEWYWFGHPVAVYSRRWLRMPVWVLRYIDERLSLCPPLPAATREGDLWVIPHSMFFPGTTGVSQFIPDRCQAKRAVTGLHRAAARGRIFHLSTHPHNFLPRQRELLPVFKLICEEAARLRDEGRLETKTMGQIASDFTRGKNVHWLEPGTPVDDPLVSPPAMAEESL